jgi:histidine ammonia-lyase
MQGSADFIIDGTPIRLSALDAALGKPVSVSLGESAWRRIDRGERAVQSLAAAPAPAYGVNTGFGLLCRKRIPEDKLKELQRRLIVSHAVGVGPPAPKEIVRWMMLFKVQALSSGVSGISRRTVDCLARMLSADLLPSIPTQGSLGASGDLAPLAHMVLPMLGIGELTLGERSVAAREALARIGLQPLTLGPKEGLALINGTQFMGAYAANIAVRARRLAKHADLIASMSLEGLAGSARPFDDRLNALRPHPGAIDSAANIRALLAASEILPSHADCDRVQDPYSLRCIPQVHGASRDALRYAEGVIETEINAVSDNPILLGENEMVSGGLFHGQPLALVLDHLAIALAEFASISERRTYLLLSGAAELPLLLMKDTGVNSGFMMPQYLAAALVSENKGLCTPSSVDSIPTSLGQEDHVSMGARAAVKCLQVLENAETVLAIELLCAAQALDYRVPLQAGLGPRRALAELRAQITHAEEDRHYGEDIHTSLRLLRSNELLQTVEREIGALQ